MVILAEEVIWLVTQADDLSHIKVASISPSSDAKIWYDLILHEYEGGVSFTAASHWLLVLVPISFLYLTHIIRHFLYFLMRIKLCHTILKYPKIPELPKSQSDSSRIKKAICVLRSDT